MYSLVPESLDDLEEMVGTMFSQVKNKRIEAPKWVDHPYGEEQMKFKWLSNLKNYSDTLILTFSIPESNFTFKSAVRNIYFSLNSVQFWTYPLVFCLW